MNTMDPLAPSFCSAETRAPSTPFFSRRNIITIALGLLALGAYNAFFFFVLLRGIGAVAGWYLKTKTAGRKQRILAVEGGMMEGADEKEEWGTDKIIGFFHPFCNAGGGGERVLWAGIRATQLRWPKAKIVVYTGDVNATKEQLLHRVKHQFNIDLHEQTVTFLYLSTRHYVLPSTWPHFTLLGQSLGSLILAWDAFHLVVPDLFIDTMGFAFALGLSRLLFPKMPTAAYVHYPTISIDMLSSLDPNSSIGGLGANAGQGTGLRGKVKKFYWETFAAIYSRIGATVDVVMTNSSWTQGHIQTLWGPHRSHKSFLITVVYPPCAVTEMAAAIPVSEESESTRDKALLCIAQFRPEKNHRLLIESFAHFLSTGTPATKDSQLVLIGSVRDDADSRLVYSLRLLANELGIKDRVTFVLDAPYSDVLSWLSRASVGVNGMWNEHFGIGVVEYEAAGLISVVHDSGGPKLDIVTEINKEPTGFHATTKEEFAEGYEKALSLKNPVEWRLRARESAKRFSEEVFADRWLEEMEKLVALEK